MDWKDKKLWLVTAVLIIGLSGYYFLQTNQNSSEDSVYFENPDWETYTNEEYNYQISYPKDWSLSTGRCSADFYDLNFYVPSGCVDIKYSKIPDCSVIIAPVNITEYNSCVSGKYLHTENITFAGIEAIRYRGGNGIGPFYCIEKNNQYFIVYEESEYVSPHRPLDAPLPELCPDEQRQILSSFRFIL